MISHNRFSRLMSILPSYRTGKYKRLKQLIYIICSRFHAHVDLSEARVKHLPK